MGTDEVISAPIDTVLKLSQFVFEVLMREQFSREEVTNLTVIRPSEDIITGPDRESVRGRSAFPGINALRAGVDTDLIPGLITVLGKGKLNE
jgi:hypothetical protein